MNSAVIQLLVLAGIAIFLILRLKNVLGTRDGFEKPPVTTQRRGASRSDLGGVDRDITDHAKEGSKEAQALSSMKAKEPDFSVSEFLGGARGAYEMILMAFEHGKLKDIKPFLSPEVYETFSDVVADREKQGLTVEATFGGVRELSLAGAKFNKRSSVGEVTVKFIGEMTSVVRNKSGKIVEGNPNEVKRQKDVWTFARKLGANDPNWQLVATGG